MTTISTADFRNGLGLMIDKKPYSIIEFQHVKPGKGPAFVRTKIRDLRNGRVNELTFRAGEKFEDVRIETREMQYLYSDGDDYVFMDTTSYEQINVPEEAVGDNKKWIRENDTCQLMYAGEELIGVEPPMFVELVVTTTDPDFKGNTVQGGTKPAVLETGAVIQVPMYLAQGERIKVDTRDGRFMSRV